MRKSIVGVYDKGSGTVVHSLHELIDDDQKRYAKVDVQSFYVGQGGWGGPRGPQIESVIIPQRDPDFVAFEKSTEESSLLYR
jgi:peroxisomal enoyl-CoA hydratase 2